MIMTHAFNRFCQFAVPTTPRIVRYPNNTTAAQLRNHLTYKGSVVIKVADCLADDAVQLPMPNSLLRAVDTKINALSSRAIVVGIDAYMALLDADNVTEFLSELRNRLDGNTLNADYLLSARRTLGYLPRYEEARKVISIEGNEEAIEPFSVQAYSDKWVKYDGISGYKNLLSKFGQYEPCGNYTLTLPSLADKQAGMGNAVSFVLSVRDVAMQHYGIDIDLSDAALELLLAKSSESGQSAEVYLANQFGTSNSNIRLALKRLLELPADNLWPAYVWSLRGNLPGDSYMAKVISGDVTRNNLLRKYVVEIAISVLSDIQAKKYAAERAEALKAYGPNYESLIVEFIGQTRALGEALQFLNCDTNAERIEIIRRASTEDLSYGLPKEYGELLPTLADYFSTDFDYGDEATTAFFQEYRRLKVTNGITDGFAKRAFDLVVPKIYPMRDAVLGELQTQSDIALLVVDAMGVEYMPLLLSLAKRRGMNIESQAVVAAKLPTETKFNPIKWNVERKLPEIKSVDNIVHNGAEKHESNTPERNFAEMLRVFEIEIMNRIAEGLTQFARVAVTADHGASRLAVIAHNENKGTTLPWNGQPKDWRYSLAPEGVAKPHELVQEYYPETKETYWVVRGYNRLPKMGGKLYELHGGATLEERLVPIVVFTRNAVTQVPGQLGKKIAAEIVDQFNGII
jgi:hypothetical protein